MIGLGNSRTRHFVLAAIGALGGLVYGWLVNGRSEPLEAAVGVWIVIAVPMLAFTLSNVRTKSSIIFSLCAGFVPAAAVFFIDPEARYYVNGKYEAIWLASYVVSAFAIFLSIFFTVENRRNLNFNYIDFDNNLWKVFLIIMFSGLLFFAFVNIVKMLNELFELIGVAANKYSFRNIVFSQVFVGMFVAFAISFLREQRSTMHAMQKVCTAILAFFAPILGLALLVFLVLLPIAGFASFWSAAEETTSLMLCLVLLALLVSNAVVRAENTASMAAGSGRILRFGAATLGLAVLPLALVAAISMGIRIHAHGLMPERIWALVFTAFAVAFGICYLWPLAFGFERWADEVRKANWRLAVAFCVAFLLLLPPIIDFSAISSRNQVGRLLSGKVEAGNFDLAALKFELGEPGRDALASLRTNDDPRIHDLKPALIRLEAATSRYDFQIGQAQDISKYTYREMLAEMPVYPRGEVLPVALVEEISKNGVSNLSEPESSVDGSYSIELPLCRAGSPWRCAAYIDDFTGDGLNDVVLFAENCSEGLRCHHRSRAYRYSAEGWQIGLRTPEDNRSAREGSLIDGLANGEVIVTQPLERELWINGRRVHVLR